MGYEYDYSLLKPKPFSAYYTPISNEKTSILGTNGAPDQIYVGEGKYRRDIDPVMVGDGYVGGAGTEEQYRENALNERLKPNEKNAGTNPLKYWARSAFFYYKKKQTCTCTCTCTQRAINAKKTHWIFDPTPICTSNAESQRRFAKFNADKTIPTPIEMNQRRFLSEL